MAKVLIISDEHLRANEKWGKPVLVNNVSMNSRTIDKIKKISEIVKKEKPDVLVSAGDLWDSHTPSEYVRAAYFGNVLTFVDKIYLIAGNHTSSLGLSSGYSESKISSRVEVINPSKALIWDDFTFIGYTRNNQEFMEKCQGSKNKFLVAHQDPVPIEYFEACFYGHIHNPSQIENAYSIGSLFKQNWNEEFFINRYLIVENGRFEFKEVQDLKLKTFTEIQNFEDGEYDIVRFKIKDKAEVINAIEQRSIKDKYEKTVVEFNLEVKVDSYKVEEVEDVHLLIKDMLKDKNLTKEELLFGKGMLEEA